jgi:hypothetical protein
MSTLTFDGYRRPDGRAGVRNHVLVVPTVICASVVAERIANAIGPTGAAMDAPALFSYPNQAKKVPSPWSMTQLSTGLTAQIPMAPQEVGVVQVSGVPAQLPA